MRRKQPLFRILHKTGRTFIQRNFAKRFVGVKRPRQADPFFHSVADSFHLVDRSRRPFGSRCQALREKRALLSRRVYRNRCPCPTVFLWDLPRNRGSGSDFERRSRDVGSDSRSRVSIRCLVDPTIRSIAESLWKGPPLPPFSRLPKRKTG